MFYLHSATSLALALLAGTALGLPQGAPHERALLPTVKLDSGTFTGTSLLGVSRFLGIPFALPPYAAIFPLRAFGR